MRKCRFSEVQILRILRQADAGEKAVGQLCRQHGISENPFDHWRRRYGGMGLRELRRQRQLEQENARPKRLLAERETVWSCSLSGCGSPGCPRLPRS